LNVKEKKTERRERTGKKQLKRRVGRNPPEKKIPKLKAKTSNRCSLERPKEP